MEKLIKEAIPCRLCYKNVKHAEQTETVAQERQVIQLFLSSDVPIREGSKIEVTQEGKTKFFKCAGKPAIYGSHQEIILEVERKYT